MPLCVRYTHQKNPTPKSQLARVLKKPHPPLQLPSFRALSLPHFSPSLFPPPFPISVLGFQKARERGERERERKQRSWKEDGFTKAPPLHHRIRTARSFSSNTIPENRAHARHSILSTLSAISSLLSRQISLSQIQIYFSFRDSQFLLSLTRYSCSVLLFVWIFQPPKASDRAQIQSKEVRLPDSRPISLNDQDVEIVRFPLSLSPLCFLLFFKLCVLFFLYFIFFSVKMLFWWWRQWVFKFWGVVDGLCIDWHWLHPVKNWKEPVSLWFYLLNFRRIK